MNRRIVVVRHARAADASAASAGSAREDSGDWMRPLTPAGRADARALGAALAGRLLLPAQAYVSSALRARETWAALHDVGAAVPDGSAEISDVLYSADAPTALAVIAGTPSTARTAVVVFHNPGAAELVGQLHGADSGADSGADPGADAAAWRQISTRGVPPCTAASFDFDGEWHDLAGPVAARLVWAWTPSGG